MEEWKGDYELQEGTWVAIPVIPWTERKVKRLNRKTKTLQEESAWAPAGFQQPPQLLFGNADWGIEVSVWRPEGKAGSLPVAVSVKLEEGLSYTIVCHDLASVLGLLNSVLPLIQEEQRRESAREEKEHYGGEGCVQTESYDPHCPWCNRSRERAREQNNDR